MHFRRTFGLEVNVESQTLQRAGYHSGAADDTLCRGASNSRRFEGGWYCLHLHRKQPTQN
jgi:hypothetical protein